MIPLPARLKLVLGLILIGGVAALQALSKVEPTWTWAGGVLQILTGLELYFTMPKAADKSDAVKAAGPLAAILLVAALSTQNACAWWNNGGGRKVETQGGQELSCVLAQVQAGNRDPIGIAVACVGGLLANGVADIESLIAYYLAGDGGGPVTSGAAVCAADGAAPPYAGIPRCISAESYSALIEARDRGHLALAAKGGR